MPAFTTPPGSARSSRPGSTLKSRPLAITASKTSAPEPLAPRHGAPAGMAPPELDRAAGGRLGRQVVAAERQHLAGESVDAERPLPRRRLLEQPPIGSQALARRERGLHDQVERGR